MTREGAIQILLSGSTHERLKAARFLARYATTAELSVLRRARQEEPVSYVKASLDIGIARLSNLLPAAIPDPGDEFDLPAGVRRQVWNHAVDWVAGLLLHEIASPIGLVKRSASREIPSYETSRTRHHLENVGRIFDAIEQLKSATAVPQPTQFDLAELLNDVIASEGGDDALDKISLHGPKPFLIMSDPALVQLVVCNGLRNALEAVAGASSSEAHPIILTWGETDIDYWVAILDSGAGIVGPAEAAFGIGKSNKQGHSGFGLAIARQAIETLGGTVTLEPAVQGGARYEARWER